MLGEVTCTGHPLRLQGVMASELRLCRGVAVPRSVIAIPRALCMTHGLRRRAASIVISGLVTGAFLQFVLYMRMPRSGVSLRASFSAEAMFSDLAVLPPGR